MSSLASQAVRPARTLLCGLTNAVFPDDCRVCGTALTELSRAPVCSSCLASVEPYECEYWCSRCKTPFLNPESLGPDGQCALCAAEDESFDGAWCFGTYEGSLQRLIQVYKYECVETLARPLGRLLAGAFPRDVEFDAIVPMPLHWWKQWQRGFNQSELLAREVSRRTGLTMLNVLRRRRATRVQAGLSLAGRRENVRHAFAVSESVTAQDALRGKHLLLIDDVLTTGATANACARVLKRAGARRVSILTAARADRKSSWPQQRQSGGITDQTSANRALGASE